MIGALDAGSYLDRLDERIRAIGTNLCLGIDPDPAALQGAPTDLEGVERFSHLLVERAAPHAAAVKINLAFFEAWGSAGMAALERVRDAIPAGLPVIADAKRGDIAGTAVRHAAALFDRLRADAVTASPYLGSEAMVPLLERSDRFVYVLCRTSNPGAAEIQDLTVGPGPDGSPSEALYRRVARLARGWGERFGTVGLVVGATAPHELGDVRSVAPDLCFLVPGVGAQGGEVAPVLREGPATAGSAAAVAGGGLLVNVSRGIASAGIAGGDDPGEAVERAARDWSRRLTVLR